MQEVPEGSLVIDYSPRLGETQPDAFETLATVPMATSWCSDQPFSVFRKRPSPAPAAAAAAAPAAASGSDTLMPPPALACCVALTLGIAATCAATAKR